ncbi:DUF3017 domain-containing protein [Streptomyces sp. NRRL S-340]|uniref:DUF3017 domain-containing protein n=1 Tax=Streptomyces sp. NRRL S-340 TaxID=1463901 RepID=UPI000569A1DD|nr:DUF3017 domain-containing protein [Streptomyces sp. NRRL S-340]
MSAEAGGAVRETAGEGSGGQARRKAPEGTGAGAGSGAGSGQHKRRARRGTRRFPLFTKDTARPEGGGRAAPGDAPAPARQWPLLTVLVVVGTGLLVTALDAFRVGLLLIGAGLLGGAVMRWMLPRVGMLAVRSRFTDIVTYGILGVVIVLLALMAQPRPWLEIPFLDDVLHYTVRNR